MTDICSLCGSEFDMEGEGGMDFCIGILPFTLCCWCLSGMHDWFSQMYCAECEGNPDG